MTEEDKNLRQGRPKEQLENSYKAIEYAFSIAMIMFVIYVLVHPWL